MSSATYTCKVVMIKEITEILPSFPCCLPCLKKCAEKAV